MSSIRFCLTRLIPTNSVNSTHHRSLCIMDKSPLFLACNMAAEKAQQVNCDIIAQFFNASLGFWEVIATFHPDGTATDILGERKRWFNTYSL